MKQIHRINGAIVKPPSNYQELGLAINYDNDNPERAVNVTQFQWNFEEWDKIKSLFDDGISGGLGVFYGVPHTITIEENGTSLEIFNGYLDLTTAEFDENQVTVESVARANIDWLNDIADSFTFDYLKEKGFIRPVVDYNYIPYVLDSVPNYKEVFIIQMTLTFITIELSNVIIRIGGSTGETATVINAPGGVVTLISDILYATLLLITIVDLILSMIQMIIQPLKYKPMMAVNTMIEKACQYLGLTYSSPILQSSPYDKLHVIPESFANPETNTDTRILGFLAPDSSVQNGYFNGTFGELLRELKTLFNLRIRIVNKELQLLPAQRTLTSASFQLPSYDVTAFRTNANEVNGTTLISFSYDTTEKQTIDNWQGNNYQVVLEPVRQGAQDLRLIKGFNRIQTRFARAIQKTTLTTPERVASVALDALDLVIGTIVNVGNIAIRTINSITRTINRLKNALSVIGIKIKADIPSIRKLNSPNFGELIEDRIGAMLLETDIISVPKLTLVDLGSTSRKNKISPDNDSYLTAKRIYELHHQSTSFAPNATNAQRYIWNYEGVEMNLNDVLTVQNEGVVKLPNGNLAEVMVLDYNPDTRLANIEIHERRIYTNNLKEVGIEPIGR